MIIGPEPSMMNDVAKLVRQFHADPGTDVDDVLAQLVAGSLRHLPAAQHAGVTVANRDGSVRTVPNDAAYAALLDDIQERHQEGPCLSAAWDFDVVLLADIRTDGRWPRYCRDVADRTPIRSTLAFRLFATDGTTGALNFHAERPYAFDGDAIEAGMALATHAALVWQMMRRDEQYRSALASRDVIGQAKGMLMERFDVDAIQAFELLKRLSQESNVPLADIAAKLVRRGPER